MQIFTESLTEYKRLPTLEVKVGDLLMGNFHPIRIQTMTTTDTMDTAATVAEAIRCIDAGAELVRITAPSKNEAENLVHIKNDLRKRGYHTPLVADIHFTPNAAEVAARIVEKVRINPGNYADKKKFENIEYTEAAYQQELERIRARFIPLVKICKEYGTAMRIGTNHGSLSDRIMSRYGDTPYGMVESAMEFLRIAESENYYNLVLSMKSSNPIVMIEAYRQLVIRMNEELGHCYPLHLGVTEAGDGEDGRIKSAIGIGTLLEDGIGDTIRVSLTEDSENEIPVCRDIISRKEPIQPSQVPPVTDLSNLPLMIAGRKPPPAFRVKNIGGKEVPVIIQSVSHTLSINDLKELGYRFEEQAQKWVNSDMPADYVFLPQLPALALPENLGVILKYEKWRETRQNSYPLFTEIEYVNTKEKHDELNFVLLDCYSGNETFNPAGFFEKLKTDKTVVLCLYSSNQNRMQSIRRQIFNLYENGVRNPLVLLCNTSKETEGEQLVGYAIDAGGLLVEGYGNGIWLTGSSWEDAKLGTEKNISIAFGILQASRKRISKTEYISCPSCGRTLFDLQDTTAKIRAVTNHLKGVKIAVMGCIVNGPGEMADADFGYVGSGAGKITLYKGKEIVKRNIPAETAVEELINLLKENNAWVEPTGQPV